MVLGNKGQIFFYTFMMAIVVLVLAVALAYPLSQTVSDARGNSTEQSVGLDCANTTISNFQKGQCIITDLATPYFIIGLIAIAGMVIGAKTLFGG